MLLERGVSVARGIVRLNQGNVHVLMTNFTEVYQHLNKGAYIAFLDEIQEESDVIAVAGFQRASDVAFKTVHLFDVNSALPQEKQGKLRALLHRYSDCFSSTSKLHQTPLAKHRVITEAGA